MATQKWVAIKQEWCNLVEQDVELMELRVYPDDVIPGPQEYKVTARKCSVDVTCNMAGFPCKWAYTNPELDPFVERERERNE
ncbi:MAG: hypothetical protein H6662_17025 [Ardenticatenaceae bacterium]|nr:hypothetical protein [Ardenticatenaceae bacterium]MCB8992033.1 hypothetical protein [Ardenticatenaceae bacterium]MCB9004708.1 hypothetical protein [Ardenticatenaceae bacterium]